MNPKHTLLCLILILLTINNLIAQQFLNKTLLHDGETRAYTLYLPANYDGSTAFPLLFNFHGGGGDIASQIAIADMSAIADTADFIVVYPQALADPNDDGSTNWLHKDPTEVDDVFFVEAMITALAAEYSINENSVYACGYSLGGEFTYELACRLNHKIAAVGVVARTMGTAAFDNCTPSHPTGILTILGTDDFVSPYGGLVWGGIQYYLSAEEMHDYWIDYNNTSDQATVTTLANLSTSDGSTVEHYLWGDGDGCVAVEHLKVIGGGHDWPGSFGNMDIDASVEIWKFVSRYNLDGLIGCTTISTQTTMENDIMVYPNPVSNYITIDKEFANPPTYEIYSTTGKLILSGQIDSANQTIDLSTISSGIYLLKIDNKILKFIKSK